MNTDLLEQHTNKEEDNMKNALLLSYLKASLPLGLGYCLFFFAFESWNNLLGPSFFILAVMVSFLLQRFNKNFQASLLLVSFLWLAPAWCILYTGQIHSPLIIWLAPTPFMAGALLNEKFSVLFGALGLIFLCSLAYFSSDSLFINEISPASLQQDLLSLMSPFSAVLLLIYYGYSATKRFKESAKKIREISEQVLRDREKTDNALRLASIGEMAGGIAHEINNPLSILLSGNRLLKKFIQKDKFNKEKFLEFIEENDETIKRIVRIVQGMRTMSRDCSEEELELVKAETLLENVLSLCEEKFKRNGVEVIVDISEEVGQFDIGCRQVQISQVFVNLMNNSFDAIMELNDRDLWIKVFVTKNQNEIKFSFIDCGDGIPEHVQKKIFNPFFTTKGVGKGTGLGMSLSKTIIASHSGSIEIDNSYKNTKIDVCLPMKNVFEKALQEKEAS